MSQICLDVSANTHKNDWNYLKRMLDELKAVDTGKHEIVIKHQLFKKAGENIPLQEEIFIDAYRYAETLGYKTTSSVFDKESLEFLLQFDIPYVKIANNRNLDWLIGEIPRKIPVYVSKNKKDKETPIFANTFYLYCVSDYPAKIEDYETYLNNGLYLGISDHTTNWDLFNKYNPEIYECHYKLNDSTGLDSGEFARTPSQLSEIL